MKKYILQYFKKMAIKNTVIRRLSPTQKPLTSTEKTSNIQKTDSGRKNRGEGR